MRFTGAVVIVGLTLASSAAAQNGAGSGADAVRPGASEVAASTPSVDVERLPVDLERIRKGLREYEENVQLDGLNLKYQIRIYGTAPPLDFFGEEANLETGPVPYGAPTHRELINQVTPQEFRAPFADFSALIRWLRERDKQKD